MKVLAPAFAAVLLAAVLIATTSSAVLAHGENTEKGHDEPSAEVIEEQKPWGIDGDLEDATRTIEVSMSDAMRFVPETITVEEGETIRFVLPNEGEVMDEFVLGTTET